jgi:N6-adenosine-specific RNA methylase IME4
MNPPTPWWGPAEKQSVQPMRRVTDVTHISSSLPSPAAVRDKCPSIVDGVWGWRTLAEIAALKDYCLIYSDPPWRFETWSAKGRSRSPRYRTLTTEELLELRIGGLAARDSTLAMWLLSTRVEAAISIATLAGFNRFTPDAFVWTKRHGPPRPRMGLGYATRRSSELCSLSFKGKPKRRDKGVPQVLWEPAREHSRKPDEVRDRLARLYPDGGRIELFARAITPGWDAWGAELQP